MKKLLCAGLFILLGHCLFAQRTITGRVQDDKGNPMPNVSVVVKGSRTGTTSRVDGTFSLSVPSGARALVFTSIDMAPQEVNIISTSVVSVTMTTQEKSMGEVFVVAYGAQTKQKVTGSVTKISGAEVENKPFSSVDQILQGKVPGLLSTAPTGQPGGVQQMRLRGIGSISAGAAPLYIVDGVPVMNGNVARNTTSFNSIAGLNPNDIESISVLKDAAAASIYGSSAANGVILITTKKGRAGKSKIKLDGEFGFGSIALFTDLARPLSRDQYFEITKEGLVNAGATQAQVDNIMNGFGFNNNYNEDWLANTTRQGRTHNLNASLSGGDSKTTFYASAGYFYQRAVVIGSDFKRYSATLNVKHKASEKLTVSINATGAYLNEASPAQSSGFRNPVADAYWLRPSQNAYNADGTVNFSLTTFNQIYNPLAILQYDKNSLNNVKVITNGTVEYQLCRDLKASTLFGIEYSNIEEYAYRNPFFGDNRTTSGQVSNRGTRYSNWISTSLLKYQHNFLKSGDLGVEFFAGYEARKGKEYDITGIGTSIPTTTLIALPVPSLPTSGSGARSDNATISFLSQAQLHFGSKYSLSGSFRRDGSSRFGTNVKYANFWSVGAAWNIEQENFMKNITFINTLKLRGSYGTNGNQDFGNYVWQGTYGFGSTYNQVPGSGPAQINNPDFTWELNKPLDIGVDITMWNNRISLTAEYYFRKTSRLILGAQTSRTVGFTSIAAANVGAMENKGWEFQLDATPVKTKDFTWDIGFNISMNKNKVTKLFNDQDIANGVFIIRVGEDLQSIYTPLWAGVDPANGNPLWYIDGTKQQKTSNVGLAQRVIIGSASPKAFGSFSTALSYKMISLDAQFNYAYGHLVNDYWGFVNWGDGAFPQFNHIQKQMGRWRKPGDETNIPKVVYNGAMSSNAESSRWYYKGDFIRLRDLTLSCTIPKKVTDKVKIENAKFYVRGSNLWTKAFDKNITFDPEQSVTGINDLPILIQRTVSIGLSLGF